MIRHIIVEGVDGAGKTRLIDDLLSAFPALSLAPRASTSTGGPVEGLDTWAENSIKGMDLRYPSISDRHPIISEPIYGNICRGKVPGRFNQGWWVSAMRQRLARKALIIWCTPPFDLVEKNVLLTRSQQMPGVERNIRHLYTAYHMAANDWPGVQLRYDYSRMSKTSLIHYVNLMMSEVIANV